MKEMYHYTSEKKWQQIRADQILKPNSAPFELFPIDGFEDIVPFYGYTVGVKDQEASDWKACGEFERLMEYTSDEVLLRLPLDHPFIFIRDIFPTSPQGLRENYGQDLRKKLHEEGLQGNENDQLDEAFYTYYLSTTLLSDYQGDFKTLEIWTPQSYTLDQIERVK
tara:strand:+ start:11600 stop:12097 length:498 start_codon:yes stop_codon:yes gene_type:complete